MNSATSAASAVVAPLNKQDLIDSIYQLLNSTSSPKTKYAADLVVTLIFSEIEKGLKERGEVKLVGFGRFYVRTRPARKNFNPGTGEMEEHPARQVAAFASGHRLKESATAFKA